MGLSTKERALLGELGELALQSASREQFRLLCLERVCRWLGMDGGALNHTSDGFEINVDSVGFEAGALRPVLPRYMAEITDPEMRHVMSGHFVSHDAVFPAARRDRLRLYTEYLLPRGLGSFCARGWLNRHGVFWMTLMREGRRTRYYQRELQGLDVMFAVISLGEALHATESVPVKVKPERAAAWLRERGVTEDESKALDLWCRGFDPDEIAVLTRRTVALVRLDLDHVLGKTKASSLHALRRALTGTNPAAATPEANVLVDLLVRDGPSSSSHGSGTPLRATRRHPSSSDRCPRAAARERLSRRELHTLQLLLDGLSDKEIGNLLGICGFRKVWQVAFRKI